VPQHTARSCARWATVSGARLSAHAVDGVQDMGPRHGLEPVWEYRCIRAAGRCPRLCAVGCEVHMIMMMDDADGQSVVYFSETSPNCRTTLRCKPPMAGHVKALQCRLRVHHACPVHSRPAMTPPLMLRRWPLASSRRTTRTYMSSRTTAAGLIARISPATAMPCRVSSSCEHVPSPFLPPF